MSELVRSCWLGSVNKVGKGEVDLVVHGEPLLVVGKLPAREAWPWAVRSFHEPLYISLVIVHTKITGGINDFSTIVERILGTSARAVSHQKEPLNSCNVPKIAMHNRFTVENGEPPHGLRPFARRTRSLCGVGRRF